MSDFLRGAVRVPDNRTMARARAGATGTPARNPATNIHDDATAQKLGFRGGTIAGSIHMDQFPPVLMDAFGPAWFETGSLSLAFKNATISGDPVVAMVGVPPAKHDVQVEARMEQPDGTVVAEGTASIGTPGSDTHLSTIDLRPTDPDDLRLLAGIRAGHRLAEHDDVLDGRGVKARIDAGALTEPLGWYVEDTPWGAPVAPPSAIVQLLRNRAGDFGREIADAVGLFGAIEVRHHHGPVLVGQRYHVEGEVVAVGASPKTEYVWYDTRASDESGRLVASMRMQLRWMKASSPLYREKMPDGPLAGIRILEFSEMIAAPFAGMHLGDLGADIIKVEPVTGEPWRLTGQFAPNESRTFISLNRNKRGLAIDLKSEAGQAVIHRLVPDMDVVLINYRPDTAAKLGVDYDTVRALNPRIIYVENTAMGRRGPQSHRPGYDLVAQAMTGLLLTGARRDEDGVPLPLTPAIADYGTGLTMAFAVCAALFARERTGVGQKVEATLLATSLALQTTGFLRTAVTSGRSIEADAGSTQASARAMNAYYRVYNTKDTMIAVACLTPALRRKMAVAIEVPDPRHERKIAADSPEATDIAIAYAKAVTERMLERTTDEWLDVLDQAGVPAGPVKAITEMADDVQVLANDLLVELDHPVAERIGMVGPIIRLHETPAAAQCPPPTLGQHNDEILAELGYTAAEIDELRTGSVIS